MLRLSNQLSNLLRVIRCLRLASEGSRADRVSSEVRDGIHRVQIEVVHLLQGGGRLSKQSCDLSLSWSSLLRRHLAAMTAMASFLIDLFVVVVVPRRTTYAANGAAAGSNPTPVPWRNAQHR